MGGWVAMGTGQYERGIQAGEEAIRFDPDLPFSYVVAAHYLSLDRFKEAEDALRRLRLANWKFRKCWSTATTSRF